MVKACRDPHPGLQFKGSSTIVASSHTRMSGGEANSGSILHALCGDETTPGKLQVTFFLCGSKANNVATLSVEKAIFAIEEYL